MEERTQSLKRKRENDYPRVTFTTGARTFDRLLKESTLDDLKEGVRRKLGYAPDVPLQLTQLRNGKTVDLEDDDDFEAFCSAASSLSVVTVQVTAPAPQSVPAQTAPLPSTSAESPKKRGRKKKKSVAPEERPQETVETSEKPGQKRKAPATDPEDKAPEAQQNNAPPPKKKQKKAVTEGNLAESTASGDKTGRPAAPAPAPTASGGATKEPKKKKAKKSAAVLDDDLEPAPAVTETEQEEEATAKDHVAAKAKEKGKKVKAKEGEKEKPKESKAEKVKGTQADKEKGKQTEDGKDKQKSVEKLEALIDKYQKEKEAGAGKKKKAVEEKQVNGAASSTSAQATSHEDSDSPSDSDSADETPSPTHKDTTSVEPAAAEAPAPNGNPKDAKDKKKAKEVVTLAANSTAPPPAKAAEPSGKKTKGTKKAATALPSEDKMSVIMARIDEMLAAKRRGEDAVTEKETQAAPVASKKKKGTATEKDADTPVVSFTSRKLAANDKPQKNPATVSAPNTSPENTGEFSPEDTEEAPVVSAVPKTSKRQKPVICPWCAVGPAHTRSRCNVVRGSEAANTRLIKQLEAEQAKSATSFREAQIEAVKELIKEKESKGKKEPKKKGGSDEGDVVTGIGANSAMSTKTAPPTTVTMETNEKPGAQAQRKSTTHAPSENSLDDTPPADEASASTAGPRKQAPTTVPPSPSTKPPADPSKPKSVTQSSRNDSASESSESDEEESLVTRKDAFIPQSQAIAIPATESASAAVSSKNAQLPSASKGPSQPKSAHQWSDEEAFPSVSQASSSRTVVPPRLSLSHASAKTRSHPLSKVTANKNKKAGNTPSDEDSDVNHDGPVPTQPMPVFPSFDISSTSLADVDLDEVIRGPRVSISTKHLDLSDDDENDEEDASVEPEGLVEDDEPKLSRRYSKMFNAAAGDSSDEEESDGADSDSNNIEEPAQRPPRLSLSAAPRAHAQEDEGDSRQSSPVDHGNLSFGDVNGMASSVEIDAQGDRAFSQALADDTAVFNLASQDIEDESPDSSGRASPANQPRRGGVETEIEDGAEEEEEEKEEEEEGQEEHEKEGQQQHHQQEEEEEEEEEGADTATAKPVKVDRHDSIEPFDSPVKTQAPRSPIHDADVLQHTPRGLRSRMKGKDGKVPESPAPVQPHSSFEHAFDLLQGVRKAEAAKARAATKAKAKVIAPPTPPADEEPEQESEAEQDAEPQSDAEPEPEQPIKGKRGKAVKPPSQSRKAVKPPSTRSQKALAATQPAVSEKPPSRTTRSSKAPPATQPAPAIVPRTTRAAARRAASVQPEETPAPPPPTQAPKHDTQESVHKWETLHPESSSQPDETMNMVDELQSVPEEDDDDDDDGEQEQLFITSETQQSFPYSQWQPQMQSTQRNDRKNPNYSSSEEEEDEVENVIMKSTKSTPGTKKKGMALAFAKLSQIASQPRSFRASLPTAGVAKPVLPDKKRRETMMADLYGYNGEDPSEESGSDSDPGSGDEAEAAPKSHIPRGRRAGLRSGV